MSSEARGLSHVGRDAWGEIITHDRTVSACGKKSKRSLHLDYEINARVVADREAEALPGGRTLIIGLPRIEKVLRRPLSGEVCARRPHISAPRIRCARQSRREGLAEAVER